MPSSLARAILRTLIYSDVFAYPLTMGEIQKWLIGPRIMTQELRIKEIKNIQEKDGYYFLNGQGKIVDLRIEREKFSLEKLKIAQETADLLKLIPFVKFVGITGALSMNNAKEKDDIDLFVVTGGGLLWTTRLLSTLLIEITGSRRHPKDVNVNNKICLNMFVAEDYLEIPKKSQNLFSAHEVLQVKPLFNRGDTYQKFLNANGWVRKYLPNGFKIRNTRLISSGQAYKKSNAFSFIETILKKFQLWYMKNRRTTEVIKEGMIRFHPHDAKVWVMKKYREKLRESNL